MVINKLLQKQRRQCLQLLRQRYHFSDLRPRWTQDCFQEKRNWRKSYVRVWGCVRGWAALLWTVLLQQWWDRVLGVWWWGWRVIKSRMKIWLNELCMGFYLWLIISLLSLYCYERLIVSNLWIVCKRFISIVLYYQMNSFLITFHLNPNVKTPQLQLLSRVPHILRIEWNPPSRVHDCWVQKLQPPSQWTQKQMEHTQNNCLLPQLKGRHNLHRRWGCQL